MSMTKNKQTYSYLEHPSDFKPTYLYIKQHKKTGLKYFGKTTKDPKKYNGSGTYWVRHLREHGNNIETIWFRRFDNIFSLKSYAENFSKENNIVESNKWANLMMENGLDGGSPKGRIISSETRKKLSQAGMKRKQTPETKRKIGESKKGKKRKKFSIEWRKNLQKNHASKKPGYCKTVTNECKRKISNTLRLRAKPVYCITNNTQYDCIMDAVEQLELSYNGVSHCVYGYQKSTRGYQFKFA